MQKTFRLFVSSTFGDFTEERKLLQTIVFPEIKRYCSSKKLNFQPIDLRWGVTEEASNDQKTLELCIEEVQNCKLQPYPNFLIMLGDRCGTIILRYTIEKEEFEFIFKHVEKHEDKTLLNTWYKLDENQIPASYIIEQRKNADESFDGVDYTNRKNWKPINTKLIEIFQNVVSKIDLEESKKNKYFKSATEVEVIEGIFKYLDKTPFQNKLLNKDSSFEHKDYEHVYSYIRNIKTLDNETLKDKFKDTNLDDVNRFKETLKSSIKKENILEVNVNLTNIKQDEKNNSLNYQYDEIKDIEDSIFVNRIITYLKKSIDEYSNIIKDLTPKELELEEQKRFKNDKLKDFLEGSRTKALDEIKNYIDGKNNQALVVYGKSGLGKSSLMAKAIQETETKYKDKKVIYKFVGSTATLINTPEILISILNELNINEEIRKVINPQTMQEEIEKLEEFFYRIHDHFKSLEQDTVIFLDAIDQINNEDKFRWLPKELQKNLKIIISALNDVNYPKDSTYFENLKEITTNLYPLEEFEENDAEKFIINILERYNRTITKTQMNYLLNIYKDVKTPLYLSVAAQELRHWKSSDNNQTLASTQKGIIEEFIENLTKLFHHDEELVKRVFSYLYLSDGLSESELLEILSIDKKFIEYIAPDTYHKKESNELPIVIWARLHSQIKEFLKLEQKDNQETMKFFHREFKYAISKQGYIKNVHEELILLLQDLIKKYQDESFESNRWGSLYIEVISTYHEKYEMVMYPNSLDVYTSIKQYSEFLTTINNKKYLEYLCLYCHKRGTYLKKSMHVPPHYLINYFVTKLIYEYYGYNENKYIESLETISNSFFEQMIGIDLARKALSMRESIYKKDKNTIFEYANSLVNYASITFHPKDSIQTLEKATKLTETLYYDSCINQKPSNFDKIVIIYIDCSLFLVYESLKFFDNPVSLYSGGFSEEYLDNFIERILEKLKAIFPIIKYNISLNQNFYLTRYYNALSKAYKRNEDIDNALDSSEKALESVNQLYITQLSHIKPNCFLV